MVSLISADTSSFGGMETIGAIVIVIYLPIFDFGQAVQSLGY